MGIEVTGQRLLDAIGEPQEGEFSQRSEVARSEVVGEGCVDALGGVDVAVRHASPDRLGRHVDQFELVGLANPFVRHRLALLRAGDARDDVVERLEMLDVERRDHVDASVEQLLDVLPALLVARPGCVGVCVLVDEHDLGPTREDRVDVHLVQHRVPVRHLSPWHHLQMGDLVGGLLAPVRLHQSDDDVGAAFLSADAFAEHLVGLADARRRTEVDAQRSAGHRSGAYEVGAHPDSSSSARLSGRTWTAGSPRTSRVRSVVCSSISARTSSMARPRSAATRFACSRAFADRDRRVESRTRRRHGVDRHHRVVRRVRSSPDTTATRSSIEARKSGLVGPRLEPELAEPS